MSTLDTLQKKLDDRTLNPGEFNAEQRAIIDALIDSGRLKGPTTSELSKLRGAARRRAAREKEFILDPLKAGTNVGQPTYELAGDLAGSIFPYAYNRKKIFRAAKEGNLLGKGPGYFATQAVKVADRLPGRFKFLGSALRGLGKLFDPLSRAYRGPLLKT